MKKLLMNSLVYTVLVSVILTASSCTQQQTKETKEASLAPVSLSAEKSNLDVQVLVNLFALNSKIFNNALKNISDKEAQKPINSTTNSISWIAGHTVDTGYNLAAILGISSENPYAADFGFGKPFDPTAKYPSLEKMLADWNALSPKIEAAIGKLTQDQLNADTPFPLPYNEQSIRGLLSFQMHHISYEVGQLGLYRKILGKESLSYQ